MDKSVTCGRLVCDVVTSARELIRARSYDLSTLCKQILGIEENSRQDFSSEVSRIYNQQFKLQGRNFLISIFARRKW